MSHQRKARELTESHNTARYFVENRHISFVLLILTILWGIYGYTCMPERKDPDIPVRDAVAMCPWPGIRAEKIEELVTRKIENKIAENEKVKKVESVTRTGLAVITVSLVESTKDSSEIFDDINLKLNSIQDLPEGAGPIVFVKDFGDTATLMLTVASPIVSEVEIELRAQQTESIIRELRSQSKNTNTGERVSLAVVFSDYPLIKEVQRKLGALAAFMADKGAVQDIKLHVGSGLALLDAATTLDDEALRSILNEFINDRLRVAELHPDIWMPAIIRDPSSAQSTLTAVAGTKYTYRELETYTDEIARALQAVERVSKVTRWGVQKEAVFLEYSQERLASHSIQPWKIRDLLRARNIGLPGGGMEIAGKNLIIDPSGEFRNEKELGDCLIGATDSGVGAYLRDIVEIQRGYESPQEINYLTAQDQSGRWHRMRAITLAVNMRAGEKIGEFSKDVEATLEALKSRLPPDLVIERTSDQPRQVEESVDLFMRSLYEAVALVVLVSLIGFWEWRSALLMAVSIPITMAMTFGMIHVLGIDLQQVSIASLIIALGLLVDDPVVANDAIKTELDAGKSREMAAWLGPTKLARAILYATITNIVAYLPFLLLKGDTGRFLYSLPIVLTCSLIASRIVSMTFIPFLGYYLLRPRTTPARTTEEIRSQGFYGSYYRLGGFLIDHRWSAFLVSLLLVIGAIYLQQRLKPQFFPNDLSYLFYVDVWLPEDAPVSATDEAAIRAEGIIRKVAADFGAEASATHRKTGESIRHITTFVGGGGPRFWYSVVPELSQQNYAQILIEVKNNRMTGLLVNPLQKALLESLPGARVDVRQLESGAAVGLPVQIRISGEDIATLRGLAEGLKKVFNTSPEAYRVKDNWGGDIFRVRLRINSDKANLAGLTNMDVARSSATAMNGFIATTLQEGRLSVPVIARMRMEERIGIGDIQNLYIYSNDSWQKIPLGQVSTIEYDMETEKIARRNHFRTITVSCAPVPGVLPSEVIDAVAPQLAEFERSLPPGYFLKIGGEYEEQVKGFKEMSVILIISMVLIYMALLFQLKNAVKPFIVFAALPYGMCGAFAALAIIGSPFGFMAYLGIISLMGVIVSHIIVLFDFIEEKLEEGEDLRSAILDAGIMRLRPVLITVGATVIALFPLAVNGGPLWEPLCYAQIGGLTVATFVTLLMVPVLYSIVAFDLKIVR